MIDVPSVPVYRGRPSATCPDCGGSGVVLGPDWYGRDRWNLCECVRVPYRCGACGVLVSECECAEDTAC